MAKVKKYNIIFKFRNGKVLSLYSKSAVVRKGDRSSYQQLHLDNVPVATLTKGSPNFDSLNNFYLYNASPLTSLYDLMPDDWDKTHTSLKIIDEIYVNTLPQNREEEGDV
jgi:hypothetical protein